MDYNQAQSILKGYKCFFCFDIPADRIGYYEKIYSDGKSTIENPTFFCKSCWEDLTKRKLISSCRGGIEGVFCFTFSSIAKMTPKTLGFLTSKKMYQINNLGNPIWKKMLFNIHYLGLPPKKGLYNGEHIVKVSN